MNFRLRTCEEEYTKDERISKADIAELMSWIGEQPHMPNIKEFMVIQCYQVSDYDISKAKTLIEALYQFKHKAPEIFTGLDYAPSKWNHTFLDINYFLELPNTTDGCRLFYIGLKDSDPSKFSNEVCSAMQVKTLFTIILEQGTCPGYVVIVDVNNFKFGHLVSLSISLSRKMMNFVQEAIPIKVKAIHVINMHMIARKIFALLRPFVSKEVWNQFHFYGNIENISKIVSKDNLPTDLGGTRPETRDDLNEITRCKIKALSAAVDEELQLRTQKSEDDGKQSLNDYSTTVY